ncbi:hypothetical protein [Haliangium ochraceum]|uniref:Uncharacterized protein n=1 Tax=Haliangium ochraceum (strain DSM 14365 / JCM 11303 / SMP-2) TaxID=502025 RepID=D0LPM1_HALO1|nr:hypothetical protein [Haliangium ochraceum]ACY15384.1 hypothetical protein Hoch_2860 [Haliangium ochraceum DSM 14365]
MSRIWLPVGILALLVPVATASADDIEQVERLPPGHELVVAAPLGTTSDILGRGFDQSISDIGPGGKLMRAYPPVFEEVPVKQYLVHYESIENALELNANARFLFAGAGVKQQDNHRYMILRVSYIDRVAVLRPEGEPLVDSDLYASKLFYGWAFHLIVEGESSSFTTDVAAKLREVSEAGAELKSAVNEHRLRAHVQAIGLQAKETGAVVFATTPEQVKQSFKASEVSVPILVEYRTRRELAIKALPWKRDELTPGTYRLDVRLEVMGSKADGRPWDGGGGPPDPVVRLFIDGVLKASCKQQNSAVHLCLNGLNVEIGAESMIQMSVVDMDLSAHDPIGEVGPWQPIGHADLNKPAFLPAQGQIKSVEVTFRPLR